LALSSVTLCCLRGSAWMGLVCVEKIFVAFGLGSVCVLGVGSCGWVVLSCVLCGFGHFLCW